MTMAAAPSDIAQQSKRPSGQAMIGALSTSSIVTALRKWALGWRTPFLWFLIATRPRSSFVQPYSWKQRVAARANMPGALMPPMTGWPNPDIGSPEPPMSVSFSTPQAITTSYTPEATP